VTAVVFSVELIGPGFDWTDHGRTREAWPWAAELTGLCPTYGFRRRFLPFHVDASGGNGKGTRGVMVYWTLRAGHLYEVKFIPSPRARWARRYLSVSEAGELRDLSREEVQEWVGSASPPQNVA
jgi:hypothetical protein